MLEKSNEGYQLGGSQTAGESYEEYSFAEEDPISVQKYIYTSGENDTTLGSSQEADWPGKLNSELNFNIFWHHIRPLICSSLYRLLFQFCCTMSPSNDPGSHMLEVTLPFKSFLILLALRLFGCHVSYAVDDFV